MDYEVVVREESRSVCMRAGVSVCSLAPVHIPIHQLKLSEPRLYICVCHCKECIFPGGRFGHKRG